MMQSPTLSMTASGQSYSVTTVTLSLPRIALKLVQHTAVVAANYENYLQNFNHKI